MLSVSTLCLYLPWSIACLAVVGDRAGSNKLAMLVIKSLNWILCRSQALELMISFLFHKWRCKAVALQLFQVLTSCLGLAPCFLPRPFVGHLSSAVWSSVPGTAEHRCWSMNLCVCWVKNLLVFCAREHASYCTHHVQLFSLLGIRFLGCFLKLLVLLWRARLICSACSSASWCWQQGELLRKVGWVCWEQIAVPRAWLTSVLG